MTLSSKGAIGFVWMAAMQIGDILDTHRIHRIGLMSASRVRGLVALAVTAMLMAAAHADEKLIQKSSVCELAKFGKEMDGRRVRVSAIYMSDQMHGSMLKDQHCFAEYIDLFRAADGKQDPSIEKFDVAVRGRGLADPELRVFSVDVSGTFHWRVDEVAHGEFLIEKVWRFKRYRGDWKKLK